MDGTVRSKSRNISAINSTGPDVIPPAFTGTLGRANVKAVQRTMQQGDFAQDGGGSGYPQGWLTLENRKSQASEPDKPSLRSASRCCHETRACN